MSDIEEARAFFINDRYAMVTTGIEIVDVKPQYARCQLKIDDRHRNAIGQVMGGVHTVLADFVFAVATNFRQPPTVTVSTTINYISAVKGDTLYAESKLIKDGKKLCFYEINITDNLGNDIALVTINGMHLQ